MKTFFLLTALLLIIGLQAQGSISGNFSPAKDFKWLVAYELTPSGEKYVADTALKEGSFTLKMPITAQDGMYRLVYAVPQDEFYIDIIYTKKEDVQFNFNIKEGVTFTKSKENQWYNEYFKKIAVAENDLMEFYKNGVANNQEYLSIINVVKDIQESYEKTTLGTIAHEFITSNRGYLPKSQETLKEYLSHKKQHHFDYLDVTDSILQSSNFLTDKISNYVFSALPANIKTRAEFILEINKNIKTVSEIISSTPKGFQVKVLYRLWRIANINSLPIAEDYIFKNHLRELAVDNGNEAMVADIESASKLRIGAVSPEINWEVNQKEFSLSTMEKAENYLLIFWSSTCDHCLNELPALHNELKKFNTLKVLAVGLEDDETNWKKVSATLPNFNHAIALGRWESEYANTFNIQQTPSYFILDSEKRFVAKPNSDKEVVEFLEN